MKLLRIGNPVLTLLAAALVSACASAARSDLDFDRDLLTREQIRAEQAVNLYDVVQRLRPRWLEVRGGTRSFNMETEIVVFVNEMLIGGPNELRQMETTLPHEIRWLDGARATATLSGLRSGRHISGAIVVYTTAPPTR